MSLETLLIWLIVGAIAGWAAGQLVKGGSAGLVGNIVIGIIGAFVGGWLFAQLGIIVVSGLVGTIISATAGAVVVLLLLRVLRR